MRARNRDPFDYVLEAERDLPKEEKTIWRMRGLMYNEVRQIEKGDLRFANDGSAQMPLDRLGKARDILSFGLLGWSNFPDEEGKEIEFRKVEEGGRKVIPDDLMTDITIDVVKELADEIEERSKLQKPQAKNS